jgi:hypothetical protein
MNNTTYTNETIVVRESKNTRRDRAVLLGRFLHGVEDDVLHVGTGVAVKPKLETTRGSILASHHWHGEQAQHRARCAHESQQHGRTNWFHDR